MRFKLTTRIRFSPDRIYALNMVTAICNEGFDKHLINCRRCALEARCASTLMVFSVIGQKRWQRLWRVAADKLIRLRLCKRRKKPSFTRKPNGDASDSEHQVNSTPLRRLTASCHEPAANRWQIKRLHRRMRQALILISAYKHATKHAQSGLARNDRKIWNYVVTQLNWCAPILL